MAILKCKMCGGDLSVLEGATVCECEYCGRRQTVPTADSEKKLTLFARANRLRFSGEFDRACSVYQDIAAQFPEEAESYWGLVLCKYGIEYVDDPATGKKIPTCHRSSFDSILEDPDFEMVMEYADAVARRVYREEAKQIEDIRKGILAVSSKEPPYDIFICYKETDENGDRTLDSVLAQDIYDALTEKGYRVFFSRITLEDKLGTEYEPYIFAALNSAKILLAVGTDYDHYNAPWVKNEWSRFLKLVALDKTKHLIPCYQKITPYDMPKEFMHLQGQDLGKIGAMQDLLHGISKLLPKTDPHFNEHAYTTTNSNSESSRIHSLLNRGYLALEDQEWSKADRFFEEALNYNFQSAQAYIGKTLVQEECSSLDAFICKRETVTLPSHSETRELKPNTDHINQIIASISAEEYADTALVRKLYHYDLTYLSALAYRKQQYQDEIAYWRNHKLLSKAEKFASGDTAQLLAEKKNKLFTELANRVQQAANNDLQAQNNVKAAYAAHITKVDQQVEQLRSDWRKRKEQEFQTWKNVAKFEKTPEKIQQAQRFFEQQGNYQNSPEMVEFCKKRLTEIHTQQLAQRKAENAARQRQVIAAYKKAQEEDARLRKFFWLSFAIGIIIIDIAMCEGDISFFIPGLFASATMQLVVLCPLYAIAGLAVKLEKKHPRFSSILAKLVRIFSLLGAILYTLAALMLLLTGVDPLLLDFWLASVGFTMALIFIRERKRNQQ